MRQQTRVIVGHSDQDSIGTCRRLWRLDRYFHLPRTDVRGYFRSRLRRFGGRVEPTIVTMSLISYGFHVA